MKNKGGSAFPEQSHPGNYSHRGMSMRDYFAARAPIDVPEWFRHRGPEYTVPPRPNYLELDPSHQSIARDWECDPCFDIPEELEWFGKKVTAYREAIAELGERNRAARFFQWRWFYADAMLAEREAS